MKFHPNFFKGCIWPVMLFFLLSYTFAELPEARKKQLIQLVEEPLYDCKYLPAEDKAFLKNYFYEIKKRTNDPTACDDQLLQVGDEATIDRYIKEFQTQGIVVYGATPSASGQARFIEVFAPVIFRDEPLVYSGGDTPGPPQSYGMTTAIIRLLRESPQLSAEVRHWALSLNERELEKNRALLQKWWRANERHFHERNYAAVQPLPEAAAAASQADTSPPAPNTQPSATPLPATTAAPEPAGENSSLLAGLITALCATLLGLAYWRVSRRGKTPP